MHTKTLAAGKGKKNKWFATPKPGSHKKEDSITLLNIVRDLIKYADNAREAGKIISSGLILVNKKPKKEANSSVGLMDMVEIPKLNKYYRVMPSPKGPQLKEISASQASLKLCRIAGKRNLPKGNVQLILHDGTTMVLSKDTFHTKDTLVLEIPSRKIRDILEYKEGNTAIISHGIHSGKTGVITEITKGDAASKSRTKVGEMHTLTNYVFVIGRDKPAITT